MTTNTRIIKGLYLVKNDSNKKKLLHKKKQCCIVEAKAYFILK